MLTTTASAVPQIKHGRARALSAAGGALAAALAWIVEVPLLGIHLDVRFGAGHIQTITIGQVIGVAVAASLLGWLLLALLERRTPRARSLWITVALAALAASLALPLAVCVDDLSRRRADRDAPDRRGRRDSRPGAHGPDPLTAPGGWDVRCAAVSRRCPEVSVTPSPGTPAPPACPSPPDPASGEHSTT